MTTLCTGVVQQELCKLFSSEFANVNQLEMSPLMAVLEMIKSSYVKEKPEVYKTLIAILNDYNPNLGEQHKEKTIKYIKSLLDSEPALADYLVYVLPKPPFFGTQTHTLHTLRNATKHPEQWPVRRGAEILINPGLPPSRRPRKAGPKYYNYTPPVVSAYVASQGIPSKITSIVSCSASQQQQQQHSAGVLPVPDYWRWREAKSTAASFSISNSKVKVSSLIATTGTTTTHVSTSQMSGAPETWAQQSKTSAYSPATIPKVLVRARTITTSSAHQSLPTCEKLPNSTEMSVDHSQDGGSSAGKKVDINLNASKIIVANRYTPVDIHRSYKNEQSSGEETTACGSQEEVLPLSRKQKLLCEQQRLMNVTDNLHMKRQNKEPTFRMDTNEKMILIPGSSASSKKPRKDVFANKKLVVKITKQEKMCSPVESSSAKSCSSNEGVAEKASDRETATGPNRSTHMEAHPQSYTPCGKVNLERSRENKQTFKDTLSSKTASLKNNLGDNSLTDARSDGTGAKTSIADELMEYALSDNAANADLDDPHPDRPDEGKTSSCEVTKPIAPQIESLMDSNVLDVVTATPHEEITTISRPQCTKVKDRSSNVGKAHDCVVGWKQVPNPRPSSSKAKRRKHAAGKGKKSQLPSADKITSPGLGQSPRSFPYRQHVCLDDEQQQNVLLDITDDDISVGDLPLYSEQLSATLVQENPKHKVMEMHTSPRTRSRRKDPLSQLEALVTGVPTPLVTRANSLVTKTTDTGTRRVARKMQVVPRRDCVEQAFGSPPEDRRPRPSAEWMAGFPGENLESPISQDIDTNDALEHLYSRLKSQQGRFPGCVRDSLATLSTGPSALQAEPENGSPTSVQPSAAQHSSQSSDEQLYALSQFDGTSDQDNPAAHSDDSEPTVSKESLEVLTEDMKACDDLECPVASPPPPVHTDMEVCDYLARLVASPPPPNYKQPWGPRPTRKAKRTMRPHTGPRASKRNN